jgi:hypothetical protein
MVTNRFGEGSRTLQPFGFPQPLPSGPRRFA